MDLKELKGLKTIRNSAEEAYDLALKALVNEIITNGITYVNSKGKAVEGFKDEYGRISHTHSLGNLEIDGKGLEQAAMTLLGKDPRTVKAEDKVLLEDYRQYCRLLEKYGIQKNAKDYWSFT